MSDELEINLRQRDEAWIIDLAGDITVSCQGALEQAYQRVVQANAPSLLINFGRVDYVASTGLSLIAMLLFRAQRDNRRVWLVGLTPHMQKLCRMMGLANYAKMCDSEEEALQHAG